MEGSDESMEEQLESTLLDGADSGDELYDSDLDNFSDISSINLNDDDEFSLDALIAKKTQLRSHLDANASNISTNVSACSSQSVDEIDKQFSGKPLLNSTPAVQVLNKWKTSIRQFDAESIKINDSDNQDAAFDVNGNSDSATDKLVEKIAHCDNKIAKCESKMASYKKKDDFGVEEAMAALTPYLTPEEPEENSEEINEGLDSIVCNDDCTIISSSSNKRKYPKDELDNIKNSDTIKKPNISEDVTSGDKLIDSLVAPGTETVILDLHLIDEETLLASDEEQENRTIVASTSVKEVKNEAVAPKNDKVLPTESEKQLAVFISDDPDENRDNNDPQWDYLRNLGSDYERYVVVRNRWKNFSVPNPKKDLSFFGFLRKNSDKSNQSSSRSYGTDKNNMTELYKASLKECTVVFDQFINEVDEQIGKYLKMLQQELEEKLIYLDECQQMERQIAMIDTGYNAAAIDTLERNHAREAQSIVQAHVMKKEELIGQANVKLNSLRAASEEVRQFHKFYPSEDSLFYLEENEIEEILEADRAMKLYDKFYV